MDEQERTIDTATQAVVEYIKDDMRGNPVFDGLVDALIQQDVVARRIQQQYIKSSAVDFDHLMIEAAYIELWDTMEQAAMRYITAKLVVEYYAQD